MADTLGLYPDIMKEIREFKALAEVCDGALNKAEYEIKRVYNEQFITKADGEGLRCYERITGAARGDNDSLEERRFRLMARFAENAPYTIRALNGYLAMLCGRDGYTLERNTGKYSVTVKVALTSKKNLNAVKALLERILPVNMVYTAELLYNQWLTFGGKKWGELTQISWQEMREEAAE